MSRSYKSNKGHFGEYSEYITEGVRGRFFSEEVTKWKRTKSYTSRKNRNKKGELQDYDY